MAGVVIGDLSEDAETRSVASQVNALGRFDAVIHNAGTGYREAEKVTTADGHPATLAVNVLAPYLLTALIERPGRLVYLSSGMHQGGTASANDLEAKVAAFFNNVRTTSSFNDWEQRTVADASDGSSENIARPHLGVR